jgi:hypothetical protein
MRSLTSLPPLPLSLLLFGDEEERISSPEPVIQSSFLFSFPQSDSSYFYRWTGRDRMSEIIEPFASLFSAVDMRTRQDRRQKL